LVSAAAAAAAAHDDKLHLHLRKGVAAIIQSHVSNLAPPYSTYRTLDKSQELSKYFLIYVKWGFTI
jgi:hypothetical protein